MLVKTLDQGITETGLFCEYYGNVVAREAGLSTPEPALIDIDFDAARMINESSAARQIGKRVPPGVAAIMRQFAAPRHGRALSAGGGCAMKVS